MTFRSPLRDRVSATRIGVAFQARIVPEHEPARPFSLMVVSGDVVIRGQMSAGYTGWVLSASALRRRRKLTLQIAARPLGVAIFPGIEQHEYEAMLSGIGSGQYEVYVTHTFYTEGHPTAFPDPRYLGGVTVAASDQPDSQVESLMGGGGRGALP